MQEWPGERWSNRSFFWHGVVAGCWLSKDKETNDAELNALITVCQKGDADVALVGSETLYRGDLTSAELIGYINRFKSAVPGFPVMTADAHSALSANPSVVHAGDAVMANSYPYWDGIYIMDAASHLRDSYLDLKEQFPDKLVVISETGWPTTGDSVGSAVPDPINAAWYFWCVESWAKTEGVVVFYFEAFDEPWKAVYEGSQGSHWGLFDQYGVLKPYMEYGFSNSILPENYWK
ncbi:MAG: glycosyl hydrolase family 17 protein [Desulfatirhabdiaceae bacterium]